MTTVFLISNNYLFKNKFIYRKDITEEQQRETCPLSFKGEKKASELLKNQELLNVKTIYSSNYHSAMSSAKYLSEECNLPIYIDERLKERKIGILGNTKERQFKENQEHDFDYKLHNGESINMVKERMKTCLKDALFHNEDETIAIFTHDIAIASLLTLWCETGFNLENQLILNYKDNVIIDGAYHPFRIFCLEFDEDKLKNMIWVNEKEL